jgi:NAD(P)-dependent dehydrogenase (short-subunit alcohol dehydrogenase family)
VIFNNAGLMPLSPLENLRIDEWDRMIDVNEILFRPTVQPVCPPNRGLVSSDHDLQSRTFNVVVCRVLCGYIWRAPNRGSTR